MVRGRTHETEINFDDKKSRRCRRSSCSCGCGAGFEFDEISRTIYIRLHATPRSVIGSTNSIKCSTLCKKKTISKARSPIGCILEDSYARKNR